MKTITKLTIGLLILALGIGLSLTQEQSSVKPSWVHEIKWLDKPDDAVKIEELLWVDISPYRAEYELVNISSNSKGNALVLRIIATIKETDSPDIYDFVYENGELIQTGYLLEAIPPQYRDEAIGIALGNQEVAAAAAGDKPTVRRVLPTTSGKFYAPKTMLSVTWKGVSALVDPDERKVAQVWKESGNVK
ncbi:MAG: hypothetical protein FIB08_02325 [Candidatus Methanoperedens sp.]|nr:hypothetical protein [Candidatus Methanoperedens sp.]